MKESSVLPFRTKKFKDKYLVTNNYGCWDFLNKDELDALQSHNIDPSSRLHSDLEKSGLVLTPKNLNRICQDYINLNINLFQGPSLHIIDLTSRCNLNCIYCHASAPTAENVDMTKETAIKVLNMIFKTNAHRIEIEFQGGECLLNWPVLQFIIEQARELNKIEKKNLTICVMSNLTLMTKDKLDWLLDQGVRFSSSLDGPKHIHDANRSFIGSHGSYDIVSRKLKMIQEEMEHRGVPKELGTIPTITNNSLKYPKEIVDEYVKWGFGYISLRHLNYLGIAKNKWDEIGYTAEEFCEFYTQAMDYILELNKQGVLFREYHAMTMLKKILLKQDGMYTEMMTPCGAGRTQITYSFDGGVYTCDEGRMINSDLFKMGDLHKQTPEEIMGSDTLIGITNASNLQHYCGGCTYNAWCGTCPVLNYMEQGNIIPRINETMRHKIYHHIFTYIFDKLAHDSEVRQIFRKWLEGEKMPVQGCNL